MNSHPDDHPLWEDFVIWADDNGVNLDDPEDWKPWWDCFTAGGDAQADLG